jgi:hypothetical protein
MRMDSGSGCVTVERNTGGIPVMNQLIAYALDESKWLAVSMCVAAVAVVVFIRRATQSAASFRGVVAAALTLFFATTIGSMAFGHLLAVTIKVAMGTAEGSLVVLYLIGLALAIPSWWLLWHSPRLAASPDEVRKAVVLNVWLGATLLGLGLHNLPLAAPAALNVGYLLHGRRLVGAAIVVVSVIINIGLLVGALVFMASGQSFEQFRGL